MMSGEGGVNSRRKLALTIRVEMAVKRRRGKERGGRKER
jgi:hypothetical protein